MAVDLTPIPLFTTFGEKIANYLGAIGIRTWVRTIERVAFMAAWKMSPRVNMPCERGWGTAAEMCG